MAKSYTSCVAQFGENLQQKDKELLAQVYDDKKVDGSKNPALAAAEELLDTLKQERHALVKQIEVSANKQKSAVLKESPELEIKEDKQPQKPVREKLGTEAQGTVVKAKAKSSVSLANTDDVGGEMAANRRQKGFSRADVDAAENETIKSQMAVKSKLWAKPDYQEIVDSGIQPAFAHIIKQLYDSISNKPAHVGEKYLNNYVDVVIEMKAAVDAFLSDESAMRSMAGKVSATASRRGRAMSGGLIDISADLVGSSGGMDYFINAIFPKDSSGNRWGRNNVKGNDRANSVGRLSKAINIDINTFMKAMKAVKEDGFPAKMEAWQRSYRIKEAGNKFEVVRKNRYSATSIHDTKEQAIDAARSLVKREKVEKFKEPETPVQKSVREGRELRDGKNVSTKDLQELTGLSKINFGSWMSKPVNAKERQAHVNSTYDAFIDLAEVLDVPVKALSLNGSLSIAIGAQGKGGRAAAHFVPGVNEINLTRASGAGSLAHEFAHGLDHYFGVQDGLDGKTDPFLSNSSTRRYITNNSNARTEIVDAFSTIMSVMKSKDESLADAKKRINAQYEMAVSNLREYVEKEGLAGKVGESKDAKAALKNIFSGEKSEYAEWPPLTKRKRKPQGVTSVDVKTIADHLGWSYQEADNLQSLTGTLAYHKLMKDGEPIQNRNHTSFYKQAGALDLKGKPYWATPHELFARAFEIYVASKLGEKNGRNDYLTSNWKMKAEIGSLFGDEAAKRYPQGDERQDINAAFDTLMAELKTKETEKGVALYSKNEEVRSGITKSQATTELRKDKRLAKALDSGLLNVVESEADIPDGAELLTSTKEGGDKQTVQGSTFNGKAYVVASGNSKETLESTAYHELTHAALTDSNFMASDQRSKLLKRLSNLRKLGKSNKFWQTVEQHVKDAGTEPNHVLDEIAAYAITEHVKGNKNLPKGLKKWAQDIIAAIKVAIFKLTGIQIGTLSVTEIMAMTKAYVDVATKVKREVQGEASPTHSKESETKQAHRVAQKNASLPISEGGLGLPANNTAIDRARAMGSSFAQGDHESSKWTTDALNNSDRELGRYYGDYTAQSPFNEAVKLSEQLSARNVAHKKHVAKSGTVYITLDAEPYATRSGGVSFSEIEYRFSDHSTKGVNGRHSGKPDDSYRADVFPGSGQTVADAIKSINNISGLRSINAAFDPMLKSGSDILYSKASRQEPVSKKGKNTSWRGRKGFDHVSESQLNAMGNISSDSNVNLKEKVKAAWDKARTRAGVKTRQGLIDQYESIKSVLGDTHSWKLAQMSNAASGAVEMVLTAGQPLWHKGEVIQIDREKKSFAKILGSLRDEGDLFFAWIAANRSSEINKRANDADAKIRVLAKDIKRLEFYVNGGADTSSINVDGTRGDLHELPDLEIARQELKRKKGEVRRLAKVSQVRERLFDPKQIKDLMALNANTDNWDGREEAYEQARKDLNELNNSVVQVGVDTGLISKMDAAIWKDQAFYVPFYRLSDEDSDNKYGMPSASKLVGQQAYKKLKGADKQLDDLMMNTIMNWQHILGASLKNNAARSALESAYKMGLADKSSQTAHSKNAVYVRENGKEVWYDIDNSADGKLVLQSLTALNYKGLDFAGMAVLRKFKRLLTIGITRNPEFIIANFMRDTLQAIAVGDMSTNFLKNVKQGWKLTKSMSDENVQAIAAGGLFGDSGYINGNDPDAVKLVLAKSLGQVLDNEHKIKAMWNKYLDFGARMENVNRSANIEQALQRGESVLDANFSGRDHLDFQRSGASTAVRFLGQTIPFLNARFQGLDRLGRALADPKQRKQAIAVILAYATASVLLYLYMKDDDDYKEAEEWERDTYHLFKLPNSDIMYRFPRPFEVGALANMVERGFEQWVDPDVPSKVFGERVGHALKETLSLSMVPQALAPMFDVMSNKSSFTKRRIESMRDEGKSSENRVKPWTTQTAIGLNKVLSPLLPEKKELSPIQIDFLINGYLGWMGSTITQMIDLVARPMVGAPSKPSAEIQDYEVVGRFAREGQGRNVKQITQLYDRRDDLNRIFADIAHYKAEKDMEKYKAAFKAGKKDMRWRKVFNKAAIQLGKYSNEIKRISKRSDLTSEQKRDKANRIYARRNKLAKQTVERFSRQNNK